MKVTQDVIIDLLPLYFSGEASEDTKLLVDNFLLQHQEFSEQIKKQSKDFFPDDIPITLTQEDEMKTLTKTKKILKARSFLLGFAIFFSLVPFSFAYIQGKFYLLLLEAPMSALIYAILGLFCWAGYIITQKKLRVTDL